MIITVSGYPPQLLSEIITIITYHLPRFFNEIHVYFLGCVSDCAESSVRKTARLGRFKSVSHMIHNTKRLRLESKTAVFVKRCNDEYNRLFTMTSSAYVNVTVCTAPISIYYELHYTIAVPRRNRSWSLDVQALDDYNKRRPIVARSSATFTAWV